MKKINYLLILSFALLAGCSASEIDYNLIQDRSGIAYLPNEPEPFTGTAVASYPSGQQQIVVSYENGKPTGISSEWYANGQMKTEQHFSGEDEGRIRDWHENGEVARDVRVLDGTFVGKNIWSVSEYRTELNMLDGYIHGNFNITDQFGAESWEYENGFEVASSHIETSDNYTYSINRQWEYSSDKTKARVSMENNTSQSKGEPAKIEPNRLGASWIEHNGPSKPKINIKTDRFLITGNVFAQSFSLKTGLFDGLRIGLTDSVLTATLFEQGNLHGYLYFFDRQKAEWEMRDWCYILGVRTWTDHIFYDDESNCKASFQEPNYKNLAIPEPFKTLIDQDKKKVAEALIEKVKAEKERKRKAEIEKKEQEEAERKRRIKAEKKKKTEEKKRQEKFAAERERIEAEFAAPPEKERTEAGAKNEDRVTNSYRQLIQRRLSENWSRPPSARLGMKTIIRIRLVPTGRIASVTVLKSSGDIAFDRSIEQAALKVEKIVEIQGMDSDLFERKFRQIDMIFSRLGDQI